MEISVPIPLDDGFLRRECQQCARQFKWFYGATNERPDGAVDPAVYFCPYCGETAPTDEWMTLAQREYMAAYAAGPALELMHDELQRAMKRVSSDFLKFSVDRVEPSPPPGPLDEPHDMTAVEPPCHPYEPLKIAEDWTDPIHCLVCGQRFVV